MAKVHYVKSAGYSRKERKCETCGHEIRAGEPYRYAEPYRRPRVVWCQHHTPKRSQVSTSKMGPLWDAVDDFDPDTAETIEEVKALVEEVRTTAEEVRDDYEAGLENIPEQLREGATGADIQEKMDVLDSYMADLDNFDPADDTEGDVRAQAEIDVLYDELPPHLQEEITKDDLHDPMRRSHLLTALDVDFSDYEARVEALVEANGGDPDPVQDAKNEARELVGNLEL